MCSFVLQLAQGVHLKTLPFQDVLHFPISNFPREISFEFMKITDRFCKFVFHESHVKKLKHGITVTGRGDSKINLKSLHALTDDYLLLNTFPVSFCLTSFRLLEQLAKM